MKHPHLKAELCSPSMTSGNITCYIIVPANLHNRSTYIGIAPSLVPFPRKVGDILRWKEDILIGLSAIKLPLMSDGD